MEAATVDQPPSQQEHEQRVTADAEKSVSELFKYSEWVHIGERADECDERQSGKCKDPNHFHAWCRMPNPFQVRDIIDKARAAKARRLRMLRDEESDFRVVLESDLYALQETSYELLAEEILEKDRTDTYMEAQRDVNEMEDPNYTVQDEEEIPKLYANIDQDREELRRQRDLPDEMRGDDYDELERHMAAYGDAIQARFEEITKPKREALMKRERDDLIDLIRYDRMEQQALEVYLHTFNTWQMYVCTFKPALYPSERVWSDIAVMKFQAPGDVINALSDVFAELEQTMARDRLGKG